MKKRSFLPLLLLGFIASGPVPTKVAQPLATPITGFYVEARTASVFAGACHYNGELVTEGKQVLTAWSFSTGSWKGVDLSNLQAMAQIVSQANLGDPAATRSCELVVNKSATDAQLNAVTDMLRTNDSVQLGQIVSTRKAPITFTREGSDYTVKAEGFAELTIRPMPNNECCSQPHLVWYSPMVPLEHRKVGYTVTASYTAGTLGDPWARADENSAFYGAFEMTRNSGSEV